MDGNIIPPLRDPASYRDTAGHVYVTQDNVYRTIAPSALEDFQKVRESPLIKKLIDTQKLISEEIISKENTLHFPEESALVIKHPKLAFISYPYEWPFELLKDAALLQCDIHLQSLAKNINVIDSSAYNIQFQGVKPIFIDSLSFRPYKEGEFWLGHKQFCEQFLNPLLLQKLLGVPYHSWYRGTLEGIPTVELSKLLPWYRGFSWNILTHVMLQAKFQQQSSDVSAKTKRRQFPKAAFVHMVKGLKNWISKLEIDSNEKTLWQDYDKTHSYNAEEVEAKRQFIEKFVSAEKIQTLWDLGCNTGMYSEIALNAGAHSVIGFDSDQGALNKAVRRAKEKQLNFLPLYQDLTNPTPNQGFSAQERRGLYERATAQGILALALIHHLAIGKNVPIPMVLDWLLSLAPKGVIEFVPKNDAMVQRLLALREDIFKDYTEENFLLHLNQRARITQRATITKSGRLLVSYER